MGAYQKGSFPGGSNIYHNLIICEKSIVIPSILQSYVLNWYLAYLLHQGMYRTEAMIIQYFYWPGIRKFVQKEVTDCDTCQCVKRSNKNMLNFQLRKLRK